MINNEELKNLEKRLRGHSDLLVIKTIQNSRIFRQSDISDIHMTSNEIVFVIVI